MRNRRLADAVDQWTLCSLTQSPGARAYYDELRARGKTHRNAIRQLANRGLGFCMPASSTTFPMTMTSRGNTKSTSPLDKLGNGCLGFTDRRNQESKTLVQWMRLARVLIQHGLVPAQDQVPTRDDD